MLRPLVETRLRREPSGRGFIKIFNQALAKAKKDYLAKARHSIITIHDLKVMANEAIN